MTKVEEIYAQALELDEEEFEELWARLAHRLPQPQIHESWLEVARQRRDEMASGQTQGIPWSEVRERMFRKVNGG